MLYFETVAVRCTVLAVPRHAVFQERLSLVAYMQIKNFVALIWKKYEYVEEMVMTDRARAKFETKVTC